MRPPYQITQEILKAVQKISEKVGELKGMMMLETSPQLRKENQIKTIQGTLAIEGNTFSEAEVTAILDRKLVIGESKEILEVQNAIEVYELLEEFESKSLDGFLKAHSILMKGLSKDAGSFRKQGVGVVKGSEVKHFAPPAANVPGLMNDLMRYAGSSEIALVKGCVFHYELEFIHPFLDGNGRMGRLWQTRILMDDFPVFRYLPVESLINKHQQSYYDVLSYCDKKGESTAFIEYMLSLILLSVEELMESRSLQKMNQQGRIEYFRSKGNSPFKRSDYLDFFKNLSTASASRDLKLGVEIGIFKKEGEKNQAYYYIL